MNESIVVASSVKPKSDFEVMFDKYTELLNVCGELSMKVNKLESSLREFEKQRVNPKFEEVNNFLININHRLMEVESLDNEMSVLNKYISDCDKARHDADNAITERVDYLERLAGEINKDLFEIEGVKKNA